MVVGVVVRGVGVGAAPARLSSPVLLGRELLRAAEHHVLEEVGEAGLARVPPRCASRSAPTISSETMLGNSGRDDDDLETVGQHLLGGLEGKDRGVGVHGHGQAPKDQRAVQRDALKSPLSTGLSRYHATSRPTGRSTSSSSFGATATLRPLRMTREEQGAARHSGTGTTSPTVPSASLAFLRRSLLTHATSTRNHSVTVAGRIPSRKV